MAVITEYKVHDQMLIAVDCIIFGFDGKNLKALLVKRGIEPELGKWSLMGGFVQKDESVEAAAFRVLEVRTGLKDIYLEQLFVFGAMKRDPGGRVVSVAYFALINIDDYSFKLMREHSAKWFDIKRIPPVIFDHKKMILMAKEQLRQKVANHPIGFELLPEKFTLPQLQNLYEAIYESTFDKRNFSRKILSLHILKKLDEKEKSLSKKGAFYYTFDHNKYKKLAKEGLKFI
ncbi:MAG: NUDIX hydrolase [Chitinophagaceae bacterium]|nr:NUDIX hydrolase [Chitinophagaceae bacterium]